MLNCDSELNFQSQQINDKSVFFHLKTTARISGFMSRHDLEELLQTLISSKLDYCNRIFPGLVILVNHHSN